MLKSLEAIVYSNGKVVLKEAIRLTSARRAIVILLEGDIDELEISETALLSEQSLAVDWEKPEEDAAWSHLQSEQ